MKDEKLREVVDIIKDLTLKRFYGKIVLNFKDGKITFLEKKETIRMD